MKTRSKLMGRLLCLALCLCMVLAIPLVAEAADTCEHVDVDKADGRCDVCGCLMQDVYLGYITASLEGNIAVNYFMLLSDEVLADETAYMQFTMADGEIIKVPVSESKLIDGYDVFTCEVAAKEMTDIITGQFYYGGEVALEHPYNVRAYAKHIIKNSNDPYAKALMEAMVNYGAASQAHFGYHTDDLASTDVATAPDYSTITIDEFPFTRGQGTQKVKLYSASLILNSETSLRLFFNGKITATYQNKNLEVKQRSGLYYVDIVNIAAKDLDDNVTVTINDGTAEAEIVFSPLSYCQIVQQDTTDAFTTEMKNLAIALYLYNKAADAYFVDDGPQGIGLKTALNNYEGNESNTITGQVTSVTFGRSNQYRDIANSYAGTLVDVDQDAPAYAYYVPNNSGYDVYVLSNDVIYAPKNSSGLFKDMTALKTVGTANLDVSRTENMYEMFRNCSALTELDVSNWDTSNVTDMRNVFRVCKALPSVDVSRWNTSNVTAMNCMFQECEIMTTVDVSNWDVSNVLTMTQMFNKCYQLSYLDVSNWNTGNVTKMTLMFARCSELTSLDVADWDVSSVQDFSSMFYGEGNQGNMKIANLDVSKWNTSSCTTLANMFYSCGYLTELDLSHWDVSKVTDMSHMFADCHRLTEVNFSGWETTSLTTMDAMFNDCRSLTTIDVSDFDTKTVTIMSQIFENCINLTTIIGLEKWDTSNVTTMEEMFSQTEQGAGMNTVLKTIDLSTWDTSKVTNTKMMFLRLGGLETIYVGDGWDMSNVTNSESMFAGSPNIVGGNGMPYDSSKTDKTYACVDTVETPGYLTYKAVENNTNP